MKKKLFLLILSVFFYSSYSVAGTFNYKIADAIPVVKVVGTAVPGGSLDLTLTGPDTQSVTAVFLTGDAKIDVDGILLSNGFFPSGNADQGAPPIPVIGGNYVLTFNDETDSYVFAATTPVVKVVGTAVPGGSLDLTLTGPDTYSITAVFLTGDARIDVDGILLSNGFFPSGNADQGAPAIPVVGGEYTLTFNNDADTYDFPTLKTKGFNSSSLEIYPNPTRNVWNVVSANETIESIKVVDLSGKILLSISSASNVIAVDASILSKGIYFAQIASSTASGTFKLVKN